MALSSGALAGTVAGLDILAGLFGYFAGEQAAQAAESRSNLLRLEAEADAVRYAEEARRFRGTQSLAYLKSGVTLEGSPLDVLDEDARIASENLSAIRARGAARAQDELYRASELRGRGRSALLSGVSSAARIGMMSRGRDSTLASAGTGFESRYTGKLSLLPLGAGGSYR